MATKDDNVQNATAMIVVFIHHRRTATDKLWRLFCTFWSNDNNNYNLLLRRAWALWHLQIFFWNLKLIKNIALKFSILSYKLISYYKRISETNIWRAFFFIFQDSVRIFVIISMFSLDWEIFINDHFFMIIPQKCRSIHRCLAALLQL